MGRGRPLPARGFVGRPPTPGGPRRPDQKALKPSRVVAAELLKKGKYGPPGDELLFEEVSKIGAERLGKVRFFGGYHSSAQR